MTTNINGTHGLIALRGNDADDKVAGAIVWWRLSGGLDLKRLSAEWLERDLDPAWLPGEPTPAVALARAVAEQRQAHRLVRRLPQGEGWVVKDERVVKAADEHNGGAEVTDYEYRTDLRCHLDDVGRIVVEPADHTRADELRAAYHRFQGELVQADISAWLCTLVKLRLQATSLRDSGGIYFVPRYSVDTWEQVKEALRTVSAHTIAHVPAMRTAEALAAILDSITQEVAGEIESINAQLSDASCVLGKRALENRVVATADIEAKLTAYEELIGARQTTLHDSLEELRARLAAATMIAHPISLPGVA